MGTAAKCRKSWTATLMMAVSILVVCVGMPLVFILGNSFSSWLQSRGVHPNPNLAGGYPIVQCNRFDTQIVEPLPAADAEMLRKALAIRKFNVRKVAFRPFSGMGIPPRINLSFEFEGQLPDPHNSAWKFSLTTIHVYIRAPGRPSVPSASDKVSQADFGGKSWGYQVIIDGLHDQARIYDTNGSLVGRGLALYVDYAYPPEQSKVESTKRKAAATTITAALPMEQLGDPQKGEWEFYVLVGIADSRHPSMMMHSAGDGSLNLFSRAVPDQTTPASGDGRPLLMPIIAGN